ncbi:hypothetical protein CYMTET_39883 [Cymbomonas tetramitiformis]|uniref:Uncharacterized protein n=1 Tax=Cymbomonas tetramitiformis TaxID=36881 RepID=A0AAE0CAK8_9CHLO|nr:hypothetical protein CYMTET_39883 [Cymbomonas tetramitiformis]
MVGIVVGQVGALVEVYWPGGMVVVTSQLRRLMAGAGRRREAYSWVGGCLGTMMGWWWGGSVVAVFEGVRGGVMAAGVGGQAGGMAMRSGEGVEDPHLSLHLELTLGEAEPSGHAGAAAVGGPWGGEERSRLGGGQRRAGQRAGAILCPVHAWVHCRAPCEQGGWVGVEAGDEFADLCGQ